MKWMIALVILAAVAGGAYFGMKRMGLGPFRHTAKVAAKGKKLETQAAPKPVKTAVAVETPRPVVKRVEPDPVRSPPPRSALDEKQAERSITRLASVYEQMPAEEASTILIKLPDALVEKLLRRMDEKQVGKLLLTFPAQRAALLTRSMSQ